MKRNPLIPFAIIAFIGIVMMVILSYQGLNKADELAQTNGHGGEVVAQNPEEVYTGNCAGCHGGNLEGGVGPKLSDVGSRLSKDDIQNVLLNGQGTGMPGGLVDAEQAGKLAEWLAEKK